MGARVKDPSTGQFKEIYVKALDSLPVGAEIDFDGNVSDIPDGYEVVSGKSLVAYDLYNNTSGATGNITFDGDYREYDYIIVTDTLNTNILNTIFRDLTISQVSFSDTLYQQYDTVRFTYASATAKTTVSHLYQGTYYSGSNHAQDYKIYKIIGIKEV